MNVVISGHDSMAKFRYFVFWKDKISHLCLFEQQFEFGVMFLCDLEANKNPLSFKKFSSSSMKYEGDILHIWQGCTEKKKKERNNNSWLKMKTICCRMRKLETQKIWIWLEKNWGESFVFSGNGTDLKGTIDGVITRMGHKKGWSHLATLTKRIRRPGYGP